MSARRRFWAIVLLLVSALALCLWTRVRLIEQDLLTRTQAVLAAAGIPFYGVDVDGRDIVLTGSVRSDSDAARIRALVSDVEGIRTVRDATIVEAAAVAPPPTRDAPADPAAALAPVRLRIQRLGDQLFVSGRLPDDGAADGLVRAAAERFGAGAVNGTLQTSPAIAHPTWLDAPERIVELLALGSGNLRLVIEGDVGSLSGQVADQERADRLRQVAASIPGVTWRFELFSTRGPIAGGGP